VLCNFGPGRRAVLTTDGSGGAAAAILTQPDDEGRQRPGPAGPGTLVETPRRSPARFITLECSIASTKKRRQAPAGSDAVGGGCSPVSGLGDWGRAARHWR
jgi:hypothetical protein